MPLVNFGHRRIGIERAPNTPAGIGQEQANPAISATAFLVRRRILTIKTQGVRLPAAAARLRLGG
ncbi:hypothetical protein EB230_31095 [Mesorhizobium sp. NZP2234]|uniref:hypothetical protein n=1 Tax=Mesorhizobium sp. NZP2234 TaxID=2483402 RepID=UPI001553B850|nr:hypothetical protein [Mesorhizobium sp. NZP2234]QKC92335.1 hypothetical protein EB230_31095 [Mesorhizobium sp. NZP2234]